MGEGDGRGAAPFINRLTREQLRLEHKVLDGPAGKVGAIERPDPGPVVADGEDGPEALKALEELIENKFGEN